MSHNLSGDMVMSEIKLDKSQASARELILVLRTQKPDWLEALGGGRFDVEHIEKIEVLTAALNASDFAAILIDEETVVRSSVYLVQELRSRFPILVIMVLSDDIDEEHRQRLIDNGADDIVGTDIATKSLRSRLDLLLRQQRKNQLLLQQSHRLHAINILSQQFYRISQPDVLINDALNLLCRHFGFYGVALVIDDGVSQLYAKNRTMQADAPPYHSTAPLEPYHPMQEVILSGLSMILDEANEHTHFRSPYVIENPTKVMILPLRHGTQVMGSMSLFSDAESFNMDDLASYELLATHFASAYNNARHHYDREADIIYRRHQVKALQEISSAYELDNVLAKTYRFVADISPVDNVVAFAFEITEEAQDIIVYAGSDKLVGLIQELYFTGELDSFFTEYEVTLQSVELHQKELAHTAFDSLFSLMGTSHILFTPIAAKTLIGGIFTARHRNQRFSSQVVNLVESIAQTTAQTIEQNTLITEIQQQKGRLENIFRSIREAIFFVNRNEQVVFCNPQFTELTMMTPSQFVGKDYRALLSALAGETDAAEDVYEQLQSAVTSVLSEGISEDYPIIELNLQGQNTTLYVEFMRSMAEYTTKEWVGIIHTYGNQRSDSVRPRSQSLPLTITENASIPLFEVEKTAAMLSEQYDMLRPRQYLQLLARLQTQMQGVRSLWQNLRDVQQIEMSGLQLKMVMEKPHELLQDAVDMNRFDRFKHRMVLQAVPPFAEIEMSETYFVRAIMNILEFLDHFAPADAIFDIQVMVENRQLLITVNAKSAILPEPILADIFDISGDAEITEDYPYRLGMYVSREIISAHGGQLTVENHRGLGIIVRVYLPIADMTNAIEQSNRPISRPNAGTELDVMIISPQDMVSEKLLNVLEFEGHQIVLEHEPDDAMLNLRLYSPDVILLFTNERKRQLRTVLESIRQKTDLPLLLAVSADAEDQAIQALSLGVDAYILSPITPDKILAQLQSIANRKTIAARVAPPMQIGELYINFSRREVYIGNELIDLTKTEYEILQLLAVNRGQIMTYETILSRVWGPEYRDEKPHLWTSVSRLRSKLKPTKLVHTEKGVGYYLPGED